MSLDRLSELKQVTLLDLVSADTTLCLAQDIKGCYFIVPTLSLGFGRKSSNVSSLSAPHMMVAIGKIRSRNFSGRRSLSRQPQSMPSFELEVAWHSILVIQNNIFFFFS